MFKEFFIKEIGTALMRPMVYIFMFLMALASALMVIFGESIGGSSNVFLNSPYTISSLVGALSLIALLVSTAFFNNAALRDYKYSFSEILFSTPIHKKSYFFGRFMGALVLSTIPLCGIFIGFYVGAIIGPLTGEISADRIGPFFFETVINSYFLFILPNMFFAGAIIFAMATKWKNTIISFLGTLSIIITYSISGTLLSDIDNETLAALSDMFGIRAYGIDTKYFTPNDKNTIGATFSGLLLMNRILWIALGFIILFLSYFSFSFMAKNTKVKKQKEVDNTSSEAVALVTPKLNSAFNIGTSYSQFSSFFKLNFYSIVKSNLFKILFVICALMLITNLWGGFDYMGLQSYPVTYKMMGTVNGISAFFVLIILVFFSGELVWRDRDSHIHEVIDATPHNSTISLLAKTLSLISVGTILNIFFIGGAILYQLFNGYTKIELGLYAQDFLYTAFPMYIVWSCVLVFIQIIINNKYLGYFVSILLLFLLDLLFMILEIETNMLSISGGPSYIYSDMNGFGSALAGSNWFNLYWILFGLLLLAISGLIWVRGVTFGFKNRMKSAKKHLTPQYSFGLSVVALLFIATASFVYYNTQILNSYKTSSIVEDGQIKYEKDYKKYEGIAQPKITDVKYVIDIYPNVQKLLAKSVLIIQNQTAQTIDSLHYTIDSDWNMKIHLKDAELVFEDKDLGYLIYKLNKPLAPNEKRALIVEASVTKNGFTNSQSSTFLNKNGTFFNNFAILPAFGYNNQYELSDKSDRKKNDLPEKLRMPELQQTCDKGCNVNYLSNGMSDWVNVETVISTSSNQLAIAPGSLLKEWKEGDRNYYNYKVDHKSQNFFNFMSARYEVSRKKWNGIDIEVYYDKAHAYNIDKMSAAIEKSLKYYTDNFGPYFHKQARIVEFPRYATFAQAFPGTMPYSESFGFIVNLEDSTDNNVIDAVVSHEMAHQWWAHQVVGATMQGATMFSESFAEYSSLMVMKKEVNNDHMQMRKFLKYDYDRYLKGRAFEQQKELPLYKVENQQYIHYGKGSVILYALQDYIGEKKVNTAMKKFLAEFRYAKPPYPTSLDFIRHLETQVPDSLNYLIDDWFKEITLYDYRLKEANYTVLANGNYEVSMDIEALKLKADTLGKETNVDVNDWADIGVFADADEKELMFYKRVKFDKENMNFTFEVDSLPAKAAIDPRRILIERNIKDNVKTVSKID
ncbi:MAG: M1 family aminopeptidase [Flavobacteriales bacterium]